MPQAGAEQPLLQTRLSPKRWWSFRSPRHGLRLRRRVSPVPRRRAQAPTPGRRINVVGTCGSGKTTVGRQLAQRLGTRFVEMDALAWRADWRLAPDEEIRASLDEATQADSWVVDGNYSRFRNLLWTRADTVVWLDYSFGRTFLQLLRRTVRRSLTGEALWHGNRERLRTALLSRESILLWGIKTYHRRRRDYPRILSQPAHGHLTVVRLASRRRTRAWRQSLEPGSRSAEKERAEPSSALGPDNATHPS